MKLIHQYYLTCLSLVLGLALDYVTDVLYWTDAYNNTLEYKESNSNSSKTLLSNLVNPEALVFDNKNRFLAMTILISYFN